MSRKKAANAATNQSTQSWADAFWSFVEANPKLAATVAFQIGVLAAEAISTPTARSFSNRVSKGVKQHMPQQLVDVMPDSLDGLAAMALKYLPGPSPKLQPRKRSAAKHSIGKHPIVKTRRTRKAKAAGTA